MSLKAQDLVNSAKANIEEIDANRLLALQSSGAPVIDVREADEFAAGHVPGAVNIPRGVLEFQVDGHPAVNSRSDAALDHRGQPVVLYCRSGGRSALAAESLKCLGFASPVSLAGGFNGWTAEGRPIEGAESA